MKKIRMGMIGGGPGSMIGQVHRVAASFDGHIELTGGVFSSDPEKSEEMGKELGLDPRRIYPDAASMIRKEAELPQDERIHFVSILTPNYLHYDAARLALNTGFHVMCDKPLTMNLEEANVLRSKVRDTRLEFGITYTYTGYPMVKEARHRVEAGALGKIRKVVVEYAQGWLSSKLEDTGHKQASWRTDPRRSGTGALGDIGTHAFNLSEYITGVKISEVCAELSSVVDGRKVDDDCNLLLHLENGGKGTLIASQISTGEENALTIKVYGDKASLEWRQMEPETLIVKYPDRPNELIRAGHEANSPVAKLHTRLPSGHPEGFNEAFANIYRNFALRLMHKMGLRDQYPRELDFPTIEDGYRGMLFIDRVVRSNEEKQTWQQL